MDLSFRDFGGQGRPIVLLHGLFGSSQNWASVGKRLTSRGRCFALDLRNHGDSPHSASHSLAECVEDVYGWARIHAPLPLSVVGHSMGGLVAMGFALAHPEMIKKIVVVDIAPRRYIIDHEREFIALGTDIGVYASRAEIDAAIKPLIPEDKLRAFLLTNAIRGEDGKFHWRLNSDALKSAEIFGDFAKVVGEFRGDSLFLIGGRSDSVRDEDRAVIMERFPNAEISTVPQADHWIPVSAPREFEDALDAFLARGM